MHQIILFIMLAAGFHAYGADCMSKSEALDRTDPYRPQVRGSGGWAPLPRADGYYVPVWKGSHHEFGVTVSCAGEVKKEICDNNKNCKSEPIARCISEDQAAKIMNAAIKGGQAGDETPTNRKVSVTPFAFGYYATTYGNGAS